MVPWNSQVSCSTMPMLDRRADAGHGGDVYPVKRDSAAVQLVEPHDQVDQCGLACPGRPDDCDRAPRLGHQRQVGINGFFFSGGSRGSSPLALLVFSGGSRGSSPLPVSAS